MFIHRVEPEVEIVINSLDPGVAGGSFSFATLELPAVKTFNLQPAVIDWPKEKLKYTHLADLDLEPVDFSQIIKTSAPPSRFC
jgi:hypothetical protein